MKVSVVTVCFNAEHTIGHTLESFLAQDHADKEMLVIDGASTDGTVGIVESFRAPAIKLVSEPDHGLYDAMNKGLSRFGGEAVGFLNADDRYADTASLSTIAEGLEQVDIVHGDLDFVDSHEAGRVVRSWRGSPFAKGGFAKGWMPPHPTFYVRRRVAETVGAFDLSYRIAADYDFMLRALELHSFTHRFLPKVLVRMQAGGRSNSGMGGYLKSNLEALRVRRRRLGAPPLDYALLAKPLSKVRQFLGARQTI